MHIIITEGNETVYDKEIDLIIGMVGDKEDNLSMIFKNDGECAYSNARVMNAALDIGGIIAAKARGWEMPEEDD